MKPFAYFLCALALMLICISPLLILSFYEKLPEPDHFSGILTLWHISGWRTGGSSAASFLEKRIAQYEALNPHVFIELVCLTAQEAQEALAQGQLPDIISYPYGAAPAITTSQLQKPDTFLEGLPETANPYMCGGYCIMINTDKLDESGIVLTYGPGIRPEKLLEAAQLGVGFDAEEGYSALPAMAFHNYPPAARPNVSTFGEPEPPEAALALSGVWEGGLELFCKDEAGLLIASHRQLFMASQSYEMGEAPAFVAFAVGGYTDMVQMIGVRKQEDDLRQAAGEDFASLLLTPGVQSKLEALGVFPVIGGLDIYREDECRRSMYMMLSEKPVLCLPGEIAGLDSLAREALSGDEKALKKLRRLLRSP